jgi:hypothetical protein
VDYSGTCAQFMSFRTNEDNIYPVGTIITAKEDVTTKLVVKKYYQRIYYCAILSGEDGKQKVYFERELIAPEK